MTKAKQSKARRKEASSVVSFLVYLMLLLLLLLLLLRNACILCGRVYTCAERDGWENSDGGKAGAQDLGHDIDNHNLKPVI